MINEFELQAKSHGNALYTVDECNLGTNEVIHSAGLISHLSVAEIMFGGSNINVQKINSKSKAVKLRLTRADVDQVLLLTLPSHTRRKLQFPSCQAVITKAECKLKNMENFRRTPELFVPNMKNIFDIFINLLPKTDPFSIRNMPPAEYVN